MANHTARSEQKANVLDRRPHSHDGELTARGNGAARISVLNDALRRSFVGGRVIATPGVLALPEAERIALLLAVRRFDNFDGDNDPHGEHDFGAVAVGAQRCFWKIDAYDRDLRGHSPDPANPAVTTRVLTLMLAKEY
ncbi:DUF3768 domain-containing protein [Methylobacterium sp. J-030]|uniref:DUF3768 domain-containing protein n=1 Tax=Methylobacterium sp. J-030 TaxID=2836627 RepID=UPI001FBC1445|nr:DUF3768 domain-containing protein [Methylobacterium sp. J-030]MCJ2067306.1 DUF3768 domain-containing protein [Methylobacterium sp. J-030]